ncbi:inorganic triphosphatase [Phascolarctobacterium sp.]|uniref:CYTH domain-containing protein n=1 Tax=Phascolarctobacterium sp. TaxID=2049039 RepID=UPI00386F7E51
MSNKEIELKLLISKENLKSLLATDFVAAAIRPDSCKKRRLVSSYYDTEDMVLKEHGIAYRVRSKGDKTYEATVKTTVKNAAGLSERLELNLPLKAARPVLSGFADMGLGYELTELAPAGVQKLFTVSVQRTTYILDLEGAVCELAIDNGKITAGEATDKIDEIEIELLEGDVGALLAFAKQITATVPMFVEKRSKFARGLALLGKAADLPVNSGKLVNGNVKEAFLALVQQWGDALLDSQNALLQGDTSDAVLKKLRRQLLVLGGIYKLTLELAGKEYTVDDLLRVGCYNIFLEDVRDLRGLQRLWARINLQGQEWLGRTSINKKLLEAVDKAETNLKNLANLGSFTAVVYAVTESVYKADLAAVTADAETVIRNALKKWVKEGDETELERVWALARCGEGKFYTKILENTKKQRRQLAKKALLETWVAKLEEICESSTSKTVYRDAGVIMGYLLAKER